jgi:hypothetical protein
VIAPSFGVEADGALEAGVVLVSTVDEVCATLVAQGMGRVVRRDRGRSVRSVRPGRRASRRYVAISHESVRQARDRRGNDVVLHGQAPLACPECAGRIVRRAVCAADEQSAPSINEGSCRDPRRSRRTSGTDHPRRRAPQARCRASVSGRLSDRGGRAECCAGAVRHEHR